MIIIMIIINILIIRVDNYNKISDNTKLLFKLYL
jgi:hypothetical protein